jgi:hypothetical protein
MTVDERLTHFAIPSFREFIAKDREVRRALVNGDDDLIRSARDGAMLAARQASSEMHRLADAAAAYREQWLPPELLSKQSLEPEDVRRWVQNKYCRALRGPPSADLDLLDDIENAFKHVELRPRKVPRRVTSDRVIISGEAGYGGGPFGEGVYGGAEQMIVTLNDKTKRALTGILQNVLDAWTLAVGRELPAPEQ